MLKKEYVKERQLLNMVVALNTVENFSKNKDSIIEVQLDNCNSERRKKKEKTVHQEINGVVLIFLEDRCRSKNIPMSILMVKQMVRTKKIAN